MTGMEWALIISALGAGAANSIGAAGGDGAQELNTFAGESRGGENIDPRHMLAQASQASRGVGGAYLDKASKPVRLRSAYVQQPGGFSGGGLPFDIGLSGSDPALSDPSLLEIPGLNFGSEMGQNPTPSAPMGSPMSAPAENPLRVTPRSPFAVQSYPEGGAPGAATDAQTEALEALQLLKDNINAV